VGPKLPDGLARWVLEHLPYPFIGSTIVPLGVDLGECHDRHRNQVDAGSLLQELPPPSDDLLKMALVGADLFYSVMTYVFGLTELGGRRGVLSCYRLRDELGTRPEILLQRTLVETVHELGHSLGLVHCVVGECPMHRTLWAEGIDTKKETYCPSCLATLVKNGH